MTIMIPAWVDGELTPVEKLDAHVRGLKHKAISVFVMNGDEVLLQRRALCKYHTPGLWTNTCCTHPHWDESSSDCAERRLDEELGIHGLTLELRDQVEYRAQVGGGMIEHEVVDIFIAEMDKDQLFEPNPLEVVQTLWVGLRELNESVNAKGHEFTPWLKIYLAEYSDRIFGHRTLTAAQTHQSPFARERSNLI